MTYTVQSFSLGTALIDPEILNFEAESIKEAEEKLDEQWKNQKCFHVRVLSPVDPTDPLQLRQRLHLSKSRPSKDRELRHLFEKIKFPEWVRRIRGGNAANVLRVRDFISETPASRLHLPASRFFYSVCGTDMEEIDPKLCLNRSKALSFEDFETCLAAAAFIPTSMEALLVDSDDWWYFLSEVNACGSKAELSFSIMEAGKEFFQ